MNSFGENFILSSHEEMKSRFGRSSFLDSLPYLGFCLKNYENTKLNICTEQENQFTV